VQLRADYDTAFAQLNAHARQMQSVMRQPRTDNEAKALALAELERALAMYRECRDRLANHLLTRRTHSKAAAAGSSASQGESQVWRAEDALFNRRDELQRLAYRLWEDSGRPDGTPDEHWYRAQELLRHDSEPSR